MSKYGEIVALAEVFTKLGRDSAEKELKKTPPPKKKDDKPLDLALLIAQKRKELAEFEQAVKDLEKMNKKEEKKDEKKGWDADKIAMLLLTLMPLNWAIIWLLVK